MSASKDAWTSHLRAAQAEDIDFLLAAGASIDEACRRVGVNRNAVERRVQRAALSDGDRA